MQCGTHAVSVSQTEECHRPYSSTYLTACDSHSPTHHEGAHHLVVLVDGIVAVEHVLAQVRPEARRHNDLTDIGADVHGLRQATRRVQGCNDARLQAVVRTPSRCGSCRCVSGCVTTSAKQQPAHVLWDVVVLLRAGLPIAAVLVGQAEEILHMSGPALSSVWTAARACTDGVTRATWQRREASNGCSILLHLL